MNSAQERLLNLIGEDLDNNPLLKAAVAQARKDMKKEGRMIGGGRFGFEIDSLKHFKSHDSASGGGLTLQPDGTFSVSNGWCSKPLGRYGYGK